ncbi:two-component sensor histidine kinase [Romeria aff. gracilis LEGE 07310]|uniref:histidine kinase n=1 Tax=Vasconcelosia minhoensis LEGE 07310 TaxID=915328 RepID=A0A8J7DRA2_9CYAN|nr:two-component system sensor histidine kinase RppB [Romeria gracilis]MBE9078094.1 two-component sensor histidine kinase [Romeria aff. gracilis LEGE 07310]
MGWDTASKPNKLFRRSRWQLTAWYTSVMAAVLGLSGIGVYQAIAHAHQVTADRELRAVAEPIHDALETTLTANRSIDAITPRRLLTLCAAGRCLPVEPLPSHHDRDLYRSSYYVRVLSANEDLIAIAGISAKELPVAYSASSWQTLRDSQGNLYRQVALPLYALDDQARLGTLLVGRSYNDFAAYLRAVRWIIWLSLPITMALIAIASWWLAGVALRPVQTSYSKIQQFTADAAHELRTPLTAVRATVESVIRLPQISDSEARETLQVIARQNQRLTTLVSDLLLLSRLDTQSPSQIACCDLRDILSDIQEELAALALKKHIHLMLEQPDIPIPAMGNEAHLYRLVLNVVSNALQHTPPEGKVMIQLQQSERQALITVEDTGTGIAPADQDRIFGRFYRVGQDRSRQSGGSGLGLSIAIAIAHSYGGNIQVQSQLGKGSSFTIRLPIGP